MIFLFGGHPYILGEDYMKKTFISSDKRKILIDAAKISFGCVAAVIISSLIGLKYSVTAGLITVLSIQNTKKETLNIALKRITAFISAALISFLCFRFIGYNTYSFGVYLFFFIIVCQLFEFQSAIVPVSVLITHILTEQKFTLSIIYNEFMLLFIGAGIGFLLNLYLRRDKKKMEETRSALDCEIKAILGRMSERVLIDDKSDYNGECFKRIDVLMRAARDTALKNRDNSLRSFGKYDFLYLDMRGEQCRILYEMYKNVKEMNATPEQAVIISDLLKKISSEYHEENDVQSLMEETEKIISRMKTQKMPQTRIEFENRAVLYSLLLKIRDFLSIKSLFMKKIQ